MNLIIDVGNTRVKVAVFEIDTIKELFVFKKEIILKKIKEITSKYSISRSIISSVTNLPNEKLVELHKMLDLIELTSQTKVPFFNTYATPKTLGVDRIALAAAAVKLKPNNNILVIDAGTCVTYDIVNVKGEYLGGAISPGIQMRYKALSYFTSKLPVLESEEPKAYIGDSTNTSIHSGVVNGILKEIDGVINDYKKDFPNLTIVLTGGDTKFLSKQLKNGIFARQNFLLEGLHEILLFNS